MKRPSTISLCILPRPLSIFSSNSNGYSWYHYQIWKDHEKRNAIPPDFDTVEATIFRKDAPAPSMVEVKDFFRFLHGASDGRITENGRMSAKRLRARAEDFYCGFTDKIGTKIDVEQKKEVYRVGASSYY